MLFYSIYQIFGTLFFVLSFPFVLLFCKVHADRSFGVGLRYGLGLHRFTSKESGLPRIWIHAASVGEVQAARRLIHELRSSRGEKCEFFLSTMTRQGLGVARRQLPPETVCFLAPLDISMTVRRFLTSVGPDIYVCMETELWPAMFMELQRAGIPSVVLNGRMTSRSFRRYRTIRGLMRKLLGSLKGLAVISRQDGERFVALGAAPGAVRVAGNIKYDFPEEDRDRERNACRQLLAVDTEKVFVCGSTRSGEEKILIGVFNALVQQDIGKVLWVIAPRHLERLQEVQKILAEAGIGFDLYSSLPRSGRSKQVVLVDTMGDLARLYSAGDVNFVGGSLVDKGGHNIMEAARWGQPVYYGPNMEDFSDAAEILEREGGAFRVADGGELAAILIEHLGNKTQYAQACEGAARAVSRQRGAAALQRDMLLDVLAKAGKIQVS